MGLLFYHTIAICHQVLDVYSEEEKSQKVIIIIIIIITSIRVIISVEYINSKKILERPPQLVRDQLCVCVCVH